jgi:hypothetical protein
MRSLTTSAASLIASGRAALAQLVYVETYGSNPPVLLNTSGWDLAWGGNTYLGAAGLGTINTIKDEPGELPGLSFEIAAIPAALSLALVDAQNMKGKACVIRTALINIDTCVIEDAQIEWTGRIDTFTIDGPTVVVTAEPAALDLTRPTVLRYTNDDQQRLYPGDMGFEFVTDSEKPIVWPAASWGRV